MTDNRTTELRAKLTEHGIEYETNDHMGAFETRWNGFTAMQLTPSAKLIMTVTPEQAIAATLGNARAERTCEFKPFSGPISDTDEEGERQGICSVCSAYMHEQFCFCPNCGAKVVNE